MPVRRLRFQSWLRSFRSGVRVGGTNVTATVSVGILAMGAATGVLVARGLGPTARGQFLIASIGPLILGYLLICGIDEALVYRLARSRNASESGRVMGSAILVGISLGAVASLAAIVIQVIYSEPLLGSLPHAPVYIYTTLPLVFMFTQVVAAAMRARQQYILWNACRASIPAIYISLVIGLGALHALSVGAVLISNYAANLALALYLAARLTRERLLRVSARTSVSLLRLGVQHHAISVGQLVNQRLDQFVLARLVSATQLGYYAVAATYASVALNIALAPAWHLYSRTSVEGAIQPAAFRQLQKRTTVAMGVVALVGAALAPIAIPTVFGHSFEPAVLPTQILLLGGPPLALSALRAAAWKASGRPLPAAGAEGLGIVATIVGLALFASRFGIVAAAWTSVIAYTLIAVVLLTIRAAPVARTPAADPSHVEGTVVGEVESMGHSVEGSL